MVSVITCNLARCSHQMIVICSCPTERRLPKLELSFIRAQRMKIGDKCVYQMGLVDNVETAKQVNTLGRKIMEQDWARKRSLKEQTADIESKKNKN
jgi:hypothetical protein